MKVVCESCQAKYQVPDERVAGKKLKIRCKRCGATVLIRGDLTQVGLADSAHADSVQPVVDEGVAAASGEPEWHASVDGQSFGPFDTTQLLLWLEEQPNGWDAHVWRDGFSDWVEVRMVPELVAGAPASASTEQAMPPLADDAGEQEEEGPTRTFSNDDVQAAARSPMGNGNGTRSQELRARASSIRARSSPSLAAAAMPSAASAASGWSGSPAGASPRVTAAQALTGERNEDSVLFSTANLQQVAMTGGPSSYGAGASPGAGFASGDASGLIDIRALASLARQTTPQIAPGASQDRFRADDDSRLAVMNQTGAFNRVDSLAPVSRTSSPSGAAVPLAILGGFALVAAAAFAAILITRESEPEVAAVTMAPEIPTSAAQPTVTPEPSPVKEAPTAEAEPAAPEPAAAAPALAREDEDGEEDELAGAKKRPRSARTAEEKKDTIPAEKAKPKKEDKAQPPSVDEVMLASNDKPRAEKLAPEPPAEKPAPVKPSTAASDIDDLLTGKPSKPVAQKNRSIDDLLTGAADSKKPTPPAAPAPAPAAAHAAAASSDEGPEELPDAPARDEILGAMRGVESAVRACAEGQTVKGTAEVQITVAGSSGRVTNATVSGITGEAGSCIARAARNAKFPRFAKPTFSIKYPYRFQ
jgi:predicted Zn finger-like uncharacterized protein